MNINLKAFSLICLSSVSANSVASSIGLEGDEIDAAMIRTIFSPTYGIGRVCCYGLDAPFIVENGTNDQQQYSSAFLLDVNSYDFELNYIGLGGWQEGVILRLSDLDFSNGSEYLSGLSIKTNVQDLSWIVGDDYIDLNLGGTRLDSGLYIKGAFEVSAVPLPASVYLFGSALVGLFGFLRKK